jgi:hypothetical protein
VAAGAAAGGAGSGRGKRGKKRKQGAGGAAFAASALGERVLAGGGAAGASGLGEAGGEAWHNAGSLNSERGGTGSGRKGQKRKHREREAGGGDVGISSVAGGNGPAPRAAQTAKPAAAEQPSHGKSEPAGATTRGKRKDGLGGGFAVGPGTTGRGKGNNKSGGRGRRDEAPGVQFYGGAAAAWATAGKTAETPKKPAPAADAGSEQASVTPRKRKAEKPQAATPLAEENKVSSRKRKTEKPQPALPVAQEAAPKRKPKRAKSSQTEANNAGSGEGGND